MHFPCHVSRELQLWDGSVIDTESHSQISILVRVYMPFLEGSTLARCIGNAFTLRHSEMAPLTNYWRGLVIHLFAELVALEKIMYYQTVLQEYQTDERNAARRFLEIRCNMAHKEVA